MVARLQSDGGVALNKVRSSRSVERKWKEKVSVLQERISTAM